MDNSTTCCFTGHRKLPPNKTAQIKKRLDREIENLISQGITTFISGGAIGFDQSAASLVIAKKQALSNIRLIFILPCRSQADFWTNPQKLLYKNLLNEADEIRYISEEYTKNCMKLRNFAMVDSSAYCICAFLRGASGTSQTVAYANKKGLTVINVAK